MSNVLVMQNNQGVAALKDIIPVHKGGKNCFFRR